MTSTLPKDCQGFCVDSSAHDAPRGQRFPLSHAELLPVRLAREDPPCRKRGSWLFILLVVACFLVAGLAGWFVHTPGRTAERVKDVPIVVPAVQVSRSTGRSQGTYRRDRSARLASKGHKGRSKDVRASRKGSGQGQWRRE